MADPDTSRLRTVAVVLAGGVGARVGVTVPKQLLKVAGKPIIEHTLKAFEGSPDIDEILVLMTPGWRADVEAIVAARGFRKVSVIDGGATRNESTQLAIDALGTEERNVLFHDAVRPLVSQRIIHACVDALREHEAVATVIPSADTIVVVDGDVVTDMPDRSRLRRAQTPQGFRLSTIRRAYDLAWLDDDFASTDDCGVVRRYLPEVPIRVVDGAEQNMKVTTPVDVLVADKLIELSASLAQAEEEETQ